MNKFFKTLICLNTLMIIGSFGYFYKLNDEMEVWVSYLEQKVEVNKYEISELESEVEKLKDDLDFMKLMNDLY